MPLVSERPIVRVEPGSMHTIETRNPENLFGLWSVFSKCSPAMAEGKRYENMAWRLWSRETFCCAPDHIFPSRWAFGRRLSDSAEMPELSSSVASDDSNVETAITAACSSRSNSSSRPELRRHDSTESRSRGREKHITPISLEKVVSSIQENRPMKPLSPLPATLSQTLPLRQHNPAADTTPRPSSPPTARPIPESSTSTVATALDSEQMSPPVGSDVSTSTDLSSHSVVHGFNPSCISTSIRSSTNLNPTPILKIAAQPRFEPSKAEPIKKKPTKFTLGGGSSEEDNNSSFEASMCMGKRSSLSDGLRKHGFNRKTTSFKDEVTTRTITDQSSTEESEEAIESDSEEEDSDNAIEDSEDDEDWVDEDEGSGPSSMTEPPMFARVDSRPELRSHRSLLTTLMHEGDRAQGFQDAAMQNSRSTTAIRRSRTSNGPSTGNSPQEDSGLMMRSQVTRSKPIIMTTSNVHPPALSPRTTRRNMLQTELTQSLRQNLLWERQQKNATTNAVNKRQHSAVSIPALRRAATTNDIKGLHAFPQQGQQGMNKAATFKDAAKNNNSYNDYFDQGLQEYHQKGW
ncbi:hypothetical protein BCR34DRAFT_495234 [Clohesyomyces aquaticus]|uniref:Uncharacterized protein n=1 Tax=Clohesyomyces aquaticus TaxID=1231657 RepID=A0A1Y1YNL2_9PLEO|nr:hypothetical protein BCR34DRAFT_495234 [Clohesyomyces aquaticus]